MPRGRKQPHNVRCLRALKNICFARKSRVSSDRVEPTTFTARGPWTCNCGAHNLENQGHGKKGTNAEQRHRSCFLCRPSEPSREQQTNCASDSGLRDCEQARLNDFRCFIAGHMVRQYGGVITCLARHAANITW